MQDFKFRLEMVEANGVKLVTMTSMLLLLYTALEKADNDSEKAVLRLLLKGVESVK